MSNHLVIFCDGASKGNPGPGGWAAIIIFGSKVKEVGGPENDTTNNRMELSAGIEALKETDKLLKSPKVEVKNLEIDIYTDSRYLINGITKWVFGWQKNNWQTKTKEDVSNKDLWEKLVKLVKNKKIKWNYVGGHIGIAGNERCDEIASGFATGEEIDLYNGSLSEYELDILNLDYDAIKKEIKSTQSKKSNSKIKAYSYLSLVNGILHKDATWAECEKRVKGKSGAKYKKSISALDEQEILKSWGVS